MTFDKDGFIAKVAYKWPFRESSVPHSTTICQLFWQFMVGLVMWPLAGGFIICLATVLISGGFLFAHKFDVELDRPFFTPYKRWPTVLGYRIWPISILGAFIAAYRLDSIIQGTQTEVFRIIFTILLCSILGALAFGADFLLPRLFARAIQENSVCKLFTARWRALRSGICTPVTFE